MLITTTLRIKIEYFKIRDENRIKKFSRLKSDLNFFKETINIFYVYIYDIIF